MHLGRQQETTDDKASRTFVLCAMCLRVSESEKKTPQKSEVKINLKQRTNERTSDVAKRAYKMKRRRKQIKTLTKVDLPMTFHLLNES